MGATPFKYGNFEKVIDFTDYRVLEKYDLDLEEYRKKIEAAQDPNKAYPVQIKEMFETAVFLLEETLGDGASNQILGDSTSLREAIDAVQALTDYRSSQNALNTAHWTQIKQKYSPKGRGRKA